MIHGSCADYRAAASIDLEHDSADINRKIECPALVFFGSLGQMAQLFDIPSGASAAPMSRKRACPEGTSSWTSSLMRPPMCCSVFLTTPSHKGFLATATDGL
jgi:hypothetical protein